MLLTVDHVTRYEYARPVRLVIQSLRLTPSAFDGQRARDWQVTVSGGIPGGAFRDGAGDRVQGWTVLGPVSEVEVRVQGTVETFDTLGILRGHRESIPPEAYLSTTPATQPDDAIRDLAAGCGAGLEGAHELARRVAQAIAYSPGTTDAATTAAAALAQGAGVCQDHAQVLISAARVVGVPARYASGYLHANADGQLHEAAHAWAELWVPDLGWVGFDAANACCPDERYIRLGSGNDAQDAAPIRGIARGVSIENLTVTVAVLAAPE